MIKRSRAQSLNHTRHITYAGVLIALMAICSWISIPTTVPFTLQTFAINLALIVMGGRRGTATIAGYLLLGLVGVPVFAQFSGGPGAFVTPSGGFLAGFLLAGLFYWGITRMLGNGAVVTLLALIIGNIAMYAFGTAWFMVVYGIANSISFTAALGMCVLPFLPMDAAKLALALGVGRVLLKKTSLFAEGSAL